jgi:maltose-binding protein MalE
MRLFIVSTVCVVAIATLSACTVTHHHKNAEPVRATYTLWINGKPTQHKTVTYEYPDPMEDDE